MVAPRTFGVTRISLGKRNVRWELLFPVERALAQEICKELLVFQQVEDVGYFVGRNGECKEFLVVYKTFSPQLLETLGGWIDFKVKEFLQ